MTEEIKKYHHALSSTDKDICDTLFTIIEQHLSYTEYKIWHAHPVWFIKGNPIVGYHKLKNCVRLLFWSGQGFEEPILQNEGKFKAAELRLNSVDEIIEKDIIRCLKKSETIQWDYKNIVKRKGVLEKL